MIFTYEQRILLAKTKIQLVIAINKKRYVANTDLFFIQKSGSFISICVVDGGETFNYVEAFEYLYNYNCLSLTMTQVKNI